MYSKKYKKNKSYHPFTTIQIFYTHNLKQNTNSHSHSQTFLDSKEVSDRIIDVVKNFDKVDAQKVTPTAKFVDDLGLDSLDSVEVVMAIEDEFAIEIPDAEADKILSVGDAVEYISGHPMAK
jgi:NADH dehydrogenase (ubiquinone) 1 alpha/beta subcomplex 1